MSALQSICIRCTQLSSVSVSLSLPCTNSLYILCFCPFLPMSFCLRAKWIKDGDRWEDNQKREMITAQNWEMTLKENECDECDHSGNWGRGDRVSKRGRERKWERHPTIMLIVLSLTHILLNIITGPVSNRVYLMRIRGRNYIFSF